MHKAESPESQEEEEEEECKEHTSKIKESEFLSFYICFPKINIKNFKNTQEEKRVYFMKFLINIRRKKERYKIRKKVQIIGYPRDETFSIEKL